VNSHKRAVKFLDRYRFIIVIFSDSSKEMTTIDSWGPKTWDFLHTIALAYPAVASESTKDAMFSMLQALGVLIPCEKCRVHYKEWLTITVSTPKAVALRGRDSVFGALVDLHNSVNARIGKPHVSMEAAYKVHGRVSGSVCPAPTKSSVFEHRAIVMLVAVCILLALIRSRRVSIARR